MILKTIKIKQETYEELVKIKGIIEMAERRVVSFDEVINRALSALPKAEFSYRELPKSSLTRSSSHS